MTATREHSVYRLYDTDSRVLYVGMTSNILKRKAHHRAVAPWWQDADRWVITGPMDKESAAELEVRMIQDFKPVHNYLHTGQPFEPPNPAPRSEEWVSVDEAAKMLGVSRWTVTRRIVAGKIAAQKMREGKTTAYLIPRSEINPDLAAA